MDIKSVLTAFTLLLPFFSEAQTSASQEKQQEPPLLHNGDDYGRNILRLNFTGIALRSYSLGYERLLSRKISAGLVLSHMPSGKIPLLSSLENAIDDAMTYTHLQNLSITARSVTPEVRFYFGKHGGARGFYAAPFARYSHYQLRFDSFGFTPDPEPPLPENPPTIDLKGNITSLTGGLMFGAQWRLWRRAYLDWWIAGAGYGNAKGQLKGTAPLNDEAQRALKQELDAMEIPFIKSETEVNANGARMSLKGPWGDFRAGISLGIGF